LYDDTNVLRFLETAKEKGENIKVGEKKMGLHVTTKKEGVPYSMLHAHDNK